MKFELPLVQKIPAPFLLFHPNIPKPMHGMNPRTMMGKHWWDIRRQEAYAKFDYHCWACGVHKSKAKRHRWLEGHESYIIDYTKGTVQLKEIVALCNYCHMGIHNGFLETQVKSGHYSSKEEKAILKRKEEIISRFLISEYYSETRKQEQCKWEDWRLVIEGVRFRPKFKTYEEWFGHYHPNMDAERDSYF